MNFTVYRHLPPFLVLTVLACGWCACSGRENGFRLDVREDLPATAGVEEAARAEFRPLPGGIPAFGYSSGPLWFRLTAPHGGTFRADAFLEVGYPPLDQVDVFYRAPERPWRAVHMGDIRKKPPEQLDANYYLVRLPMGTASQMYVRVQSNGPLLVPIELRNGNDLPSVLMTRNLLFGGYFGLLFIVAALNLVMFGVLRESAFGFYALYTGSLLLSTLYLEGYGARFTGAPWWNNMAFVWFGTQSYAWAALFASSYLGLRHQVPALHRLLVGAATVLLAWVALGLFLPYRTFQFVAQVLVLLTVAALLGAGVRGAMRGSRPARIFLAAWIVLLVSTIALVFSFSGIIRNMLLAKYSVLVGSAAEVVLIMVGLADRFRLALFEKEEAQRMSLARQTALTKAYARFVPPQLLQHLGRTDITEVALGDVVRREMTVFFLDIRGFTRISEGMTPEENFAFINALLKRTGPVIREKGGFIDKYIGDAIMALFPDEPEPAIEAAVRTRQLLAAYNVQRRRQGYEPVEIGIGIHSGPLMLGTIGEAERMEGTVIADTVNLASRMEGLTKTYGACILISEQTLFRLPDPGRFHFRVLDRVRVKGKRETVSVIEIYDGDSRERFEAKEATKPNFERGQSALLSGDFESAVRCFESVLQQDRSDTAAQLLLERASRFVAQGPPADWQGVSEPER